jgi:hypothetical protein
MRTIRIICLAVLFIVSANAFAGVTLDFWHSYVPPQTGVTNYSFHLTDYKRGLFWGSCGPSTKSLQWAYTFNLAGNGTNYSSEQIALADDNGKPVKIISGQIAIDTKHGKATIKIEIEQAGATNKFIGNGEYKIVKLK